MDIENHQQETPQPSRRKSYSRRKLFFLAASIPLAFSASLYWKRRWNYIVIHHSGGNFGNIEFIQEVHRQRQKGDPIDAIPYHYLIGNGNGMKMGEVASDWRQEYDIWGTHVSINNRDRNFRGLGICLVGNFEEKPVPEQQYQAVLALTRQLMQEFSIPAANISGHGLTKGESTLCPGKHFPMARFMKEIQKDK